MIGTAELQLWHRLVFLRRARFRDCKALLRLASFAVEGICGEVAVRQIACRSCPPDLRIDIDVGTRAGALLVDALRALARREYGDGGLIEDRLLPPGHSR